jgi:hypothetical protein
MPDGQAFFRDPVFCHTAAVWWVHGHFDADRIADLVLPRRLRRIVATFAVVVLVVVPGAQSWVLRQAQAKIERETKSLVASFMPKPSIPTSSANAGTASRAAQMTSGR